MVFLTYYDSVGSLSELRLSEVSFLGLFRMEIDVERLEVVVYIHR